MAKYWMRWDPTNKKWEVSVDGGAFSNVVERSYSVRVHHNADVSISDNTQTVMPFNGESWDSDGFHSTSSNNSRLTVPTGLAGKYIFHATVFWDGVASPAGYRSIAIAKNTAGTFDASKIVERKYQPPMTVANVGVTQEIDGMVDLAEGDHLEVWVIHTQGASLNIKVSGTVGQSPTFGMALHGA